MTERKTIHIGTRGSALALWQAEWVRRHLQRRFPSTRVELTIMKTMGDKILDSPLAKIGDKGLFTKELENALLEGSIDLAVHSFKDVPTKLPYGLLIAAVCEREDVRDVFIPHPAAKARKIAEVPRNGTLATGSLRRKSQLLHMRPDLTIVDIRGNLETRIRKLKESNWDGMLLAHAGVSRLGKQHLVGEVIPTSVILPAVGQGALAIEIRQLDDALMDMLAGLNHRPTQLATMAERALLRRLEGGCQIPIGAFGRIKNDELILDAMVGSLDGKRVISATVSGLPDDAEMLGTELAMNLIDAGADDILREIHPEQS